MTPRLTIPTSGHNKDELLRTMSGYREGDADWRKGHVFSLVYYAGDEHHEFLKKAHNLFFAENGLNPMAFKSLKRMEAEVVQMSASMLNGPETACGTMTTGGTESVLMAVKAARERARSRRPWIRSPNIVAPRTIHPAMEKAAHYFGLELRYAPLRKDLRADVDEYRKLVDRNTVLLAASAPQYAHGVIDPIAEIAVIAREKRIPFHVDACIGGFLLPWVEKLGRPIPPWDFRVPGVTSISADLHKFGYAAKGASVVIYRDMSYLKHQFFIATEYPGGIYASPTMPGTRAGGTIAAAWAAMMAMGQEGYLQHASKAMQAADKLKGVISSITELEILSDPEASLLSYASRDPKVDIYAVADQLEDRGWMVDRQQHPPSIHLTVTSNHLPIVDEYAQALRDAVSYVKSNPKLKSRGNAAMYGMMAKVPFRGLIRQSVQKILEDMYGPNAASADPMKDKDGPLMKTINRVGGVVLGALDRAEQLGKWLRRR